MSTKPNPEKPAKVVFFIISVIMLISGLMFVVEGGLGAILIFILAIGVSIVIAFLFFTYFSVYYKWARWGVFGLLVFTAILLFNFFHDTIIDYYSDMRTPKKYKNYKVLLSSIPYHKQGKTISFLSKRDGPGYGSATSIVFLNDKNELILVEGAERLYKYDTYGGLIAEYYIREGYYANDMMKSCYFDTRNNKYLTWAIDGDTVPKPITFLKESAEWNDSESEAFFEEMKQTTDAFFIENEGYIYRKEPENRQLNDLKVIFSKDNEWYYFFLPFNRKYEERDEDGFLRGLISKNRVKSFMNFEEGKFTKRESEQSEAIQPQYTSYDNKDFYYDLVIDGVTFNIKDYRERNSNLKLLTTYFSTPTETMEVFAHLKLYSNKNLHYKLFNDRGRTYIIKNE
ncbi:hypothetical protein [Capnocytophaga sp. oral taxon 878]|uniref:hypothetical protein n=1 Tax=Capnocytophaga sp. oral taxon 878 TaxID=1316596 RepID=UPI000D028497|nr:hypothetical protein [Capnocytophaga sp. oral taxon 878]AVM49546.1 hypothetical protein C4H12_03165 [Capnocytophaga sp. oral taxon 878]